MSTPLLLDRREGSGDLHEPLLLARVPVELTTLEFGDAELIGRGPDDRPIPVCVEIKTVGDLLNCIGDGRFTGHQLPGMLAGSEVCWLLLEGQIRPDDHGRLTLWRRGAWRRFEASAGRREWEYASFIGWLHSLTEKTGVRVASTVDRQATVCWLSALYWWWQKPWEQHDAVMAMHRPRLTVDDPLALYAATTKMRVAADLAHGVGPKRARAIGHAFRSVKEMVNAPVERWQEVEGIGGKLARQIVAEIEKEG